MKKELNEVRIVFPYSRKPLTALRKPEIVWLASNHCHYTRYRHPSFLEDYSCLFQKHPELKNRFPAHLGSLNSLSKGDIIWLATHYCSQIEPIRSLYVTNYKCFLREHPELIERIGFLDIETSNLQANFGIMLTYCILDSKTGKILHGQINKEDIITYPDDKTDSRIIRKLINDMLKFDRIVTHYGRKFDLPFIRTRAIFDGIEFPGFGSIANDDTWLMAKRKLRLNSNRQDTVDRTLYGNTNKTRINFHDWIAAERGNQKALNEILDHNKRDVIALKRVWEKLNGFVGRRNTSI